MASLQDIRRRIKSVKNTQQITKAMKMVAAARLRRAQEAAVSNRPYAEKMYEVIADVASNAGSFSHPLLEVREEGKTLYIVLASDKGLAGAYASNVFKETMAHIKDKANTSIVTVGRRAKEYFTPRGFDIVNSYMGFTERPDYQNARQIALDVIERFAEGNYKEVYLVYTKFISAISAVPQVIKLLPFTAPKTSHTEIAAEYIYEPNAQEVLGYLLPQYIVTMIYASLLQSAASELSSRMNAMSNATDNAEELISKLDLHYNKVRQAGITREITEIVGGAEALK
ncbi:MAG TPA: ATP synthase F1 subunit gamma [Megamonas hypermegale]|uniref:ATP synthase gamma chain n=1 Tax=Megamonas hypermegale TaxID=158847 RepID=A0A921HNY6_9FIRM|nr:ATP synthase F1 subunit gamma [Megamonas hypermegale]MDM8143633.1 ATP synthase F1 subunit gamma [Megamonas hypermegale]HJF85703.1 ATP synthase F1 subunit gamma [Megamonas hypermegale]